MFFLAIETSCDETAAAVFTEEPRILASVVASQTDLHARFGGVVPEVAARAHLQRLLPIIDETLRQAGIRLEQVGCVAVHNTPGLVGALLVGVSTAKMLALALGVPLVAVNHVEAHVYACRLAAGRDIFPCVGLVVSGGHTTLFRCTDALHFERLGSTRDDAAGEAFDKVARFLGLPYPGGPAIDRLAMEGDRNAIAFPRAMLDEGYDFSFSGLKTSVLTYVRKHPDAGNADVAASFQEAVVDVLVTKARRAAREVGATGVCLAGGVAANSALRERVLDACIADGLRPFVPSREMCTDNAAMVAAAGWYRLRHDGPTPLSAGAIPGLRFPGI